MLRVFQPTSRSGGGTGAAGAEAAGGPRRTEAAAEGAEEAPRSSRRGGGGGDLRDADRVRRGRFRSGRGRRAPPRGLSCCCSLHHLIFFPALWALRAERETRNGFLTPIFRIFQTRWFGSARAWRDVLNTPYPNGQKNSLHPDFWVKCLPISQSRARSSWPTCSTGYRPRATRSSRRS